MSRQTANTETIGQEKLLQLKARLDSSNLRHDGGRTTVDILPEDFETLRSLVDDACKASEVRK